MSDLTKPLDTAVRDAVRTELVTLLGARANGADVLALMAEDALIVSDVPRPFDAQRDQGGCWFAQSQDLRIDAIQLTVLCRTPDYAELAPPSRRLPLVCVHIIRHSLTVDRLLTRTWGAAPFSTGTSENARVATGCARCRGHRFCGWCSWIRCDAGELCRTGHC
jgi:hypothetical protein